MSKWSMLLSSRGAPSSLLHDAPLDESEASRVHRTKQRRSVVHFPHNQARPRSAHASLLRPQPIAARPSWRLDSPPGPTLIAAEEALTKPDVDELLGVELVLGQGTSAIGVGGRRSSGREIAQSRARIESLIGQYEEIEMEGGEGEFDAIGKLKDNVMMMVMDFKIKANKNNALLHAAHTELEGIARWSNEAVFDEGAVFDESLKCATIERRHVEQLVDRLGRLKEVQRSP